MSIFEYPFMQRAFLVGILLALIIPCVGIVIVLKRLSTIGDALLVAHYNPALPTAVFLLPNHAVARWPALCHDDTPPVQQHNIPRNRE